MSDYQKLRKVILFLCKEKGACESEFRRLLAATAVRRKPTQLDRIEETAGTFHHTVTTALRNFDKRITEQGKVLDSICGSLALDMGDRLKSHADMLHKIQSDLSLMKSGASFMQELDRVAKEEQGLEDGDYTDASKEVADALTAMGYDWYDADRDRLQYITWGKHEAHLGLMVNMHGKRGDYTHRTNFLSRARVTAKKLGLVPREEPKEEWKVGDWYWNARRDWKEPQRVDAVKGEQVFTEFEGDLHGYFKSNIVKATPAEISEHESKIKAKEEEQKLARLTFGTRVIFEEESGWKIAMDVRTPTGLFAIVKEGHARLAWAEPRELTIID